MKVTVVGTGYVGLVAGACFSSFGLKVTCLDNNKNIIDRLNNGELTIHEPGLEEVIKNSIASGNLSFTDSQKYLDESDIIIIAVGTPQSDDGSANLDYLNGVIDDITKFVTSDKTVIIKSTVPVGTAQTVREKLKKQAPDLNFDVISNPEFLREGSAVDDFMNPDRIVIGLQDALNKQAIENLYAHLIAKKTPIFFTDNASAELIKYASNCYLAMRLAFLNEMSDISEKVGGNIDDISTGIGMDSRIGKHYLKVGPGFGGSCFPKDTEALNYLSSKLGVKSKIVSSVIDSNEARKNSLAQRTYDLVKDFDNPTVTILGVTFKANTDDIRDSASLDIIDYLEKNGVNVKAYDPSFTTQFSDLYQSINSACENSDLIVICTEWSEFKSFDYQTILNSMRTKQIFDLRNLLDKFSVEGFEYHCLGRK